MMGGSSPWPVCLSLSITMSTLLYVVSIAECDLVQGDVAFKSTLYVFHADA